MTPLQTSLIETTVFIVPELDSFSDLEIWMLRNGNGRVPLLPVATIIFLYKDLINKEFCTINLMPKMPE